MFFRMKILICCKPAVIDKFNLLANIWTHLADVNEQAQERLDLIMEQMKACAVALILKYWHLFHLPSLFFSCPIKPFLKILAVHSPCNRDKTLLLQLVIQFLDELVSIRL